MIDYSTEAIVSKISRPFLLTNRPTKALFCVACAVATQIRPFLIQANVQFEFSSDSGVAMREMYPDELIYVKGFWKLVLCQFYEGKDCQTKRPVFRISCHLQIQQDLDNAVVMLVVDRR